MVSPRNNNQLLAALSEDEFARLSDDFEHVKLDFKEVLHESGEPTPHVHFPVSGVVSMLTTLSNGWSIELATVGNEGMIDIAVFLGTAPSESRNIVQVEGDAFRMQSDRFKQRVAENDHLRELLGAYTLELFTMTAQNTACYRTHSAKQRIARWLLMTYDRVGRDAFAMTHEFLTEMTGTARPGITKTLGDFEQAAILEQERRSVRIFDHERLKAESCECYFLISERFRALAARGRADRQSSA